MMSTTIIAGGVLFMMVGIVAHNIMSLLILLVLKRRHPVVFAELAQQARLLEGRSHDPPSSRPHPV